MTDDWLSSMGEQLSKVEFQGLKGCALSICDLTVI